MKEEPQNLKHITSGHLSLDFGSQSTPGIAARYKFLDLIKELQKGYNSSFLTPSPDIRFKPKWFKEGRTATIEQNIINK